jgi:uncharacterized membrane protein YozB (DUF420 family)
VSRPDAREAPGNGPGYTPPPLLNELLASLAFVLLFAGWTQRRRRARHVPLVLAGIGLDLALVVWLEVMQHVVEKVAGASPHGPFPIVRWAHIISSTGAVVLYLPTLWLGLRMLRGTADARTRKLHAAFATSALALRTVGFLCMWGVELAKS